MQVVVIAGAPGTGKSTVSSAVQQVWGCPLFEFGWIPEFRETGVRRLGYVEEQDLAGENLVLVTNNYGRHGFQRVILTDLPAPTAAEASLHFPDHRVQVSTLRLVDRAELRRRVLEPTRNGAYRDWRRALQLNSDNLQRPARPEETFVDVDGMSVDEVAGRVREIAEA